MRQKGDNMNIYKKIIINLLVLTFSINLYSEEIYIFGTNVNLREKSDEKSKSLRKLNGNTKGFLLKIFKNENSDYKNWSKIRLEDDTEGFIYSDYIYDQPQDLNKIKKIFPEIQFEYRNNKILLFDKKTSKIYSEIIYKTNAKSFNRTDQIGQYLLITLTINDYEYDGFIYDLETKKIIFVLNKNSFDLMTCSLESVSPQNIFLILDTGTSQNRQKYIFEISTWQLYKLQDIYSSLDWIAPKTFIYYDYQNNEDKNLKIEKVPNYDKDKEGYALQVKRIWNNGNIISTKETRWRRTE
jgi:hypothetical protein